MRVYSLIGNIKQIEGDSGYCLETNCCLFRPNLTPNKAISRIFLVRMYLVSVGMNSSRTDSGIMFLVGSRYE